MPYDSGKLGFPLQPNNAGGVPALQAMSEALDRQQMHEQWHEDNPGKYDCPSSLCPPEDYANIERGCDVLNFGGGGTIEPGDAFIRRGGR